MDISLPYLTMLTHLYALVLDESSLVFAAIELMTSLLFDGKVDKSNVHAYDAWVNALIRHYENHVPVYSSSLLSCLKAFATATPQLDFHPAGVSMVLGDADDD